MRMRPSERPSERPAFEQLLSTSGCARNADQDAAQGACLMLVAMSPTLRHPSIHPSYCHPSHAPILASASRPQAKSIPAVRRRVWVCQPCVVRRTYYTRGSGPFLFQFVMVIWRTMRAQEKNSTLICKHSIQHARSKVCHASCPTSGVYFERATITLACLLACLRQP